MTGSGRLARVRRAALGLLVAALHAGPWGGHSGGRLAQPVRAAQAPAAQAGEGTARRPRDPFRPVVRRSAEPLRTAPERPRGLPGLRVGEVELVGIVETEDARLAVLEAPDGRSYVTRAGDRLADGLVREVAGEAVLFAVWLEGGREGAVPGRDVRKTLTEPPPGP
ncbi:MAG: hypothetical protein OXH04_06455 [Acidobacteria bacterium]|nr:hypothetical protein [Acidobacteriota bacterium]